MKSCTTIYTPVSFCGKCEECMGIARKEIEKRRKTEIEDLKKIFPQWEVEDDI